MKFYYAIGVALSPFMSVVFWIYNRLGGVVRPRVLVMNAAGEVLLVRSWTGHQGWELPGGGRSRNETVEDAARREVKEELGLDIAARPLLEIGTITVNGYVAPLFKVILSKREAIARNRWELSGAVWYSTFNLPAYLGPAARWALENNIQKTNDLL